MEHLAIVVPMIMVPLTFLAAYGAIWPEPNGGQRTPPKKPVTALGLTAGQDLSYR